MICLKKNNTRTIDLKKIDKQIKEELKTTYNKDLDLYNIV